MQTTNSGNKGLTTGGSAKAENKLMSVISTGNGVVDKIKAQPSIAHLIRAVERFGDRLGSQFGAAITYFSFLSIIPIFMVSFAAAGFILASYPELFDRLIDNIIHVISEPTLAATLERTVTVAVQQRTTVGITGLLLALYSGISWMVNLRDAVRAQTRDVWERNPEEKDNFIKRYVKALLSLLGLMAAMIFTIALTSIAGAAQSTIINALGLNDVEWLRLPLTLVTLAVSIGANFLMFLWIFWILPDQKPARKALFRGALMAAFGFEIIKFIMTFTVPNLVSSPSGAAFGSIIALLAFFYFFARLTLFCAAWIATADYPKPDQRLSKLSGVIEKVSD